MEHIVTNVLSALFVFLLSIRFEFLLSLIPEIKYCNFKPMMIFKYPDKVQKKKPPFTERLLSNSMSWESARKLLHILVT